MEIRQKKITIRELVKDYKDNDEKGVVAYGKKLDVRPAYQREFVYKEKQREAVIETIRQGFPLNILYWVDREDGTYEVLDGQQRIISICQFHNLDFDIKPTGKERYKFDTLAEDQQKQFLDYELDVYFCVGEKSEKIDWFRVVNVAGEPLNDQELLNAFHAGKWLEDAKIKFSKRNCRADEIASDYVNGSAIRQDYLRTALIWKSKGNIESYMVEHSAKDTHATPLWNHFEKVINWVKQTFPVYRKEMKGVNWGELYDEHKGDYPDPKKLEKDIKKLMMDEEIGKLSGIYYYVLNGKEKYLNLRAFPDKMKRKAYEEQNGKCKNKKCPDKDKTFEYSELHGDHIKPWSKGGKTEQKNLQMLCRYCNQLKGMK